MARHPLLLGALLSVVGSVGRACAFSPPPSIQLASTANLSRQTESSGRTRSRPLPSRLFADSNDDDDDDDDFTAAEYGSRMQTRADGSDRKDSGNIKPDDSSTGGILQRFLSPRIDDPGLPLTDVLLAQIVAPTLQVYYVAHTLSPNPSWLVPVSSYFGEAPELAPRGSLLAPAADPRRGTGGVLAARSWEREAVRG